MDNQVVNVIYVESFAHFLKAWMEKSGVSLANTAALLDVNPAKLKMLLTGKWIIQPETIYWFLTKLREYNSERRRLVEENEKNVIKEVI